MPALQVILFDLGGTLLHYEQPPEGTFEAINGRALGAFLQAAVLAGATIADPPLAVSAVARLAAAMEARAARAQHAEQCRDDHSRRLTCCGRHIGSRSVGCRAVGILCQYRSGSEACFGQCTRRLGGIDGAGTKPGFGLQYHLVTRSA